MELENRISALKITEATSPKFSLTLRIFSLMFWRMVRKTLKLLPSRVKSNRKIFCYVLKMFQENGNSNWKDILYVKGASDVVAFLSQIVTKLILLKFSFK